MAIPFAHLRAAAALPVGYKGPRASILVELNELEVSRLVDDLHPASPDRLEEFVVRNRLEGHAGALGGGCQA